MNYYELGAGLAFGAGLVASFIYLLLRIRRIESQLIVETEKNIDAGIEKKNSIVSEAELDHLLDGRLGRKP